MVFVANTVEFAEGSVVKGGDTEGLAEEVKISLLLGNQICDHTFFTFEDLLCLAFLIGAPGEIWAGVH